MHVKFEVALLESESASWIPKLFITLALCASSLHLAALVRLAMVRFLFVETQLVLRISA